MAIKKVICSNCGKGLFNVSYPESGGDKINIFDRTDCPHCNSYAFEFSVNGKISCGPIGEDESSYPTTIADVKYISKDKFKVIVKKK